MAREQLLGVIDDPGASSAEAGLNHGLGIRGDEPNGCRARVGDDMFVGREDGRGLTRPSLDAVEEAGAASGLSELIECLDEGCREEQLLMDRVYLHEFNLYHARRGQRAYGPSSAGVVGETHASMRRSRTGWLCISWQNSTERPTLTSMENYPPRMLDVSASASVCSDTINGWLWYCDEHDTHGNADSQEEAQHMADAHVDYHLELDEGEADPCDVMVWFRTEHERAGE